LNIERGGLYLDATLGRGGHTRLILQSYSDVKVLAIDRDEDALTGTQAALTEDERARLVLWRGNFADYDGEDGQFNGIIADLGVSSPQLDQSDRGFSFRQEAPLDMRMDQSQSFNAADIINHWEEKELADLFYNYGEERLSRRIAKQIVQKRPFYSTTQLAETVYHCAPPSYRHGKIHPATRVFQALRLMVNQELESLDKFLEIAPRWLKVGGRIAIISFHSLEDRRVKYGFREHPLLSVVTKKPLIPGEDEQKSNPRSRSAKLRIAQRIDI
jgi:16S rRNA (cytosine1402-N4)-methyltransferase